LLPSPAAATLARNEYCAGWLCPLPQSSRPLTEEEELQRALQLSMAAAGGGSSGGAGSGLSSGLGSGAMSSGAGTGALHQASAGSFGATGGRWNGWMVLERVAALKAGLPRSPPAARLSEHPESLACSADLEEQEAEPEEQAPSAGAGGAARPAADVQAEAAARLPEEPADGGGCRIGAGCRQ
jgi:hypothetical protein